MTVNTKRTKTLTEKKHSKVVETKSHKNWMAGESYDVSNPIVQLRIAASSCFFGEPMYYQGDKNTKPTISSTVRNDWTIKYLRDTLNAIDPQDWRGLNPTLLMERAIDAALDFDAEATLREAVRLRKVEYIRTTPQVILVRAANHKKVKGTNLINKYAPDIVDRADEPAVCLAYQLSNFGKPIPNSLKRALRTIISGYNEYKLAKYKMESREVKTVDVINLVHAKSEAVSKLMKGELKLEGDNETWESLHSAGKSWEECIPVMGHMALLRNLRNFNQNNVNPNLYLSKLVEGAPTGKQLPFRYWSAYKNSGTTNPKVLDAIEECMTISLGNLPNFTGRTMSLCDNSGSAHGTTTSDLGTVKVSEIANLSAILTGMNADEGYVGVFGDSLQTLAVRKKASIFDTLNKVNDIGQRIGQATENGIWIFLRDAIANKQHWDNIFVYSDMQAGHGGLYGIEPREYSNYIWGKHITSHGRHIDVAGLVLEYRKKINPNVNVFLVQVAGYQDTIIPEFYDRTYILGGWSTEVLRFANAMINLNGGNNDNKNV